MEKCYCGCPNYNSKPSEYYEVDSTGSYVKAFGMMIAECVNCGAKRQANLPFNTKEEYLAYYKKYPPVIDSYEVKDFKHDSEVAVKRFDTYQQKHGIKKDAVSILDVGAGSGAFVQLCLQEGLNAYGCEIAKYHSSIQDKIYQKDFEDIHFPTDHFDYISCHDVLEHVLNPLSFMQEIFRVLDQKGVCFIEIPDFNSKAGKHHWKKEHIWYFSEKDIKDLFAMVGFELIETYKPIESKICFHAVKPEQDRTTILMPPGIGDSYWSVVKLESFLQACDLDLPDVGIACPKSKEHNGHQRAFPFLEMFPFLHASWDTIDGKAPGEREIWMEAYARPERTVFQDIAGYDYFISYNGHLRVGEELADADEYKCNWFPDMFVSLEQEQYTAECKKNYGRYIVFYFVFQGTYKRWTSEFPITSVIESIKQISQTTGCTPVLVGGTWDSEDSKLIAVRRAVPNIVNLIGKTSVDQLFGLLKGSELVVGYPSGLTIISAVLKAKTLCIWNNYYNRNFFWNAVPPEVRGSTYFIDDTYKLSASYLTKRSTAIIEGTKMPEVKPISKKVPPVKNRPPKVKARKRIRSKKDLVAQDQKNVSIADDTTVVCVYKTGGPYTAEYVYKLYSAVKRNSEYDIDFLCLTDDKELKGDFRTLPLTDNFKQIEEVGRGWWSKIELFKKKRTDRKYLLFFDLDTVIIKNIDCLLESDTPFSGLLPWNRHNRERGMFASGMMKWEVSKFHFIYAEFTPDIIFEINGDQEYMSNVVKAHGYSWEPWQNKFDGIYSYKRNCRRNGLPKDAMVVCFHGKPRIHNTHIKWVEENWR